MVYGNIQNGYDAIPTDVNYKLRYSNVDTDSRYVELDRPHFGTNMGSCKINNPQIGCGTRLHSYGYWVDFKMPSSFADTTANYAFDFNLTGIGFYGGFDIINSTSNIFCESGSFHTAERYGYYHIQSAVGHVPGNLTGQSIADNLKGDINAVSNISFTQYNDQMTGIKKGFDSNIGNNDCETYNHGHYFRTKSDDSAIPANTIRFGFSFNMTHDYNDCCTKRYSTYHGFTHAHTQTNVGNTQSFYNNASSGGIQNYAAYQYTSDNGYLAPNSLTYASNIPAWYETHPYTQDLYWSYQFKVIEAEEYRGFKSGTYHSFGLVYYDRANRSSAVCKAGSIHVPIQFDRDLIHGDNGTSQYYNYITGDVGALGGYPNWTYPPHNGLEISKLYYQAPWIEWEINHKPPLWATHYQWVYTGNENIKDSFQLLVDYFRLDTKYKGSHYTTEKEENENLPGYGYKSIIPPTTVQKVVKVDVTNIITHYSATGKEEMDWDWAKGDRLRIIANETDGQFNIGSKRDYEIIDVQEYIDKNQLDLVEGSEPKNNKLYYILEKAAIYGLGLEDVSWDKDFFKDSLIEIYRPQDKIDEEGKLYYEFDEKYEIANAGTVLRAHTSSLAIIDCLGEDNTYPTLADAWSNNGSMEHVEQGVTNSGGVADVPGNTRGSQDVMYLKGQHQYYGIPARGMFQKGDCYYRVRSCYPTDIGNIVQFIEDFEFSDYFPSKVWGKGRPNAYLPDFGQIRRYATIAYSEPYVPNTKINGLSTFYPDISFQEYDRKYNSIQKLHSLNDSLIILQEDKVSKAMVSRSVLFDATAEQNVAISSNILSSGIPYIGDYGICRNPESFVNFGFRSYFFDIRRGAVLRLSQNGLTPISEFKMKNFFTDYCEEVRKKLQIGKFKCYATYDNKFDEYVISIPHIAYTDFYGNKARILGFTIGFHEPSKRWNSFYSFSPEWMETYGTGFMSFLEGDPWQHNITGDEIPYNVFHDMPGNSILYIPSNSMPTVNKIYQTISEDATDVWEVTSMTTRNGQETNMLLTDFTGGVSASWQFGHGTKENVHHASIMCDINTPNVSLPKIEGDRMRDTSAMFKLRLISPTKQNVLFSVKFGFIASGSPDLFGNQEKK